jgi:hypothetical protein
MRQPAAGTSRLTISQIALGARGPSVSSPARQHLPSHRCNGAHTLRSVTVPLYGARVMPPALGGTVQDTAATAPDSVRPIVIASGGEQVRCAVIGATGSPAQARDTRDDVGATLDRIRQAARHDVHASQEGPSTRSISRNRSGQSAIVSVAPGASAARRTPSALASGRTRWEVLGSHCREHCLAHRPVEHDQVGAMLAPSTVSSDSGSTHRIVRSAIAWPS